MFTVVFADSSSVVLRLLDDRPPKLPCTLYVLGSSPQRRVNLVSRPLVNYRLDADRRHMSFTANFPDGGSDELSGAALGDESQWQEYRIRSAGVPSTWLDGGAAG